MLGKFKSTSVVTLLHWNRLGTVFHFIIRSKFCEQQQAVGAETPRPVSAISERQLQTTPFKTEESDTQIMETHDATFTVSFKEGVHFNIRSVTT